MHHGADQASPAPEEARPGATPITTPIGLPPTSAVHQPISPRPIYTADRAHTLASHLYVTRRASDTIEDKLKRAELNMRSMLSADDEVSSSTTSK